MVGRLHLAVMMACLWALTACAAPLQPEASVKSPETLEVAKQAVAPPFQREEAVQRLLKQADSAFERGRYTTPVEDNAYDRYRAVLMLDPDNGAAQAGLDGVLLAYIDYVRSVMAAGQLAGAQELVSRVESHFPEAPMLSELSSEIQRARAAVTAKREKLARQDILNGEKILLPDLELSRRSDKVIDMLVALAQRVQNSGESVMILARNDSEGRWIYKEMQDSVSGYRIRGDIRISRVPAVVIMAPL